MRRRRKSKRIIGKGLVVDEKQQNLISQWALTVLLVLRVWKKLADKSNGGFTYEHDILAAIGLEHLEDEEMDKKEFLEALENQQEKFANAVASPNKYLERNCKEIAEYIGLNNAEQQILQFTVLLKEDQGLQDVTGKLGEVNVEAVAIILSIILELDRQETRDALSRQGLLARSGLISVDRESQFELNNKLDLLDGLGEALQEADVTVETLLQHYFTLGGCPRMVISKKLGGIALRSIKWG